MADTHAFSGAIPGLVRQIMCAWRLAPESRSVFRTRLPAQALPVSFAGPAPLAGGGGVISHPAACRGRRLRGSLTRPESASGRRAQPVTLPGLFECLVRETRASAGIELAISMIFVLPIAALALDIYSMTRAHAAGARVAAIMADYVSRESAPDGDEVTALGEFLHKRELRSPPGLVYVISAVHEPAGDDPADEDDDIKELWSPYEIPIGDSETTTDLVEHCEQRAKNGWRAALIGDDASLTLEDDGVLIVVEICVELDMVTSRFTDIPYRVHVLPLRIQGLPEKPVHSPSSDQAAVLPVGPGQ